MGRKVSCGKKGRASNRSWMQHGQLRRTMHRFLPGFAVASPMVHGVSGNPPRRGVRRGPITPRLGNYWYVPKQQLANHDYILIISPESLGYFLFFALAHTITKEATMGERSSKVCFLISWSVPVKWSNYMLCELWVRQFILLLYDAAIAPEAFP
jgi:hypothetical protein